MAENYPKDINEMLSALSFERYYPEKLTAGDLNEITELSIADKEQIKQEDICWHMIHRLTRLNYQARHTKIESKSSEPSSKLSYLQRRKLMKESASKVNVFHPLDIATSIFLCCDPVAKQDLVKCLWSCKLAIPLVVQPDKSKPPDIYEWPLRSLIGQWQGGNDTISSERPLFDNPMEKIGFMRVGDLGESKSALLNCIIGGSEKVHPMFFHRDLGGSQKQRSSVVEGLIEIGWSLPKGTDSDSFHECKLFANLRGDASVHTRQVQFLLETMDTLVILTETKHLESCYEYLKAAIDNHNKTLLLLTDLTDSQMFDEENDNIEKLLASIGNIDDGLFEIIPLSDKRQAEKVEEINKQLSAQKKTTFIGLHDAVRGISNDCWYVDQQNNDCLRKGIQMADGILDQIKATDAFSRKSKLLKVQGDMWKRWTWIEKEIHRLDAFRKTEFEQDISSYRNSLEEKKWEIRKEQLELTKSIPTFLREFIRCLRDLNEVELSVFLRSIKLGLDEITRDLLRPYYSTYMDILLKKTTAPESSKQKLQEQLDALDKNKVEFSIGLEHLMRELGQIFEASFAGETHDENEVQLTGSDGVSCKDLPHLVSKILLHGYPVELMDGDAGYVPEAWVQHVLTSLNKRLTVNTTSSREPRVHVLSVLGVQSSGKSTFLNTAFGLQFSVSAGSCTKGVFMQILKVEQSLRDKLGYDYVFAIDTEGLRSAKLSTKFENELSCFSIALSDTTVINLMGENATYLQENLPIVVHAILRMNLTGLKPRCVIVHHNVNKRDKEKLLEQGQLLEKVLNELTAKACDIDDVDPPRRFTDLIEFDTSKDTDYVPAYIEGEQTMGPISLGYSKECDSIRKKLLEQQSGTCSRRLSIKEFSIHLQLLWEAIKTNDFVFEFKSTRETMSRLHLDEQFSKLHRGLLEDILKISKPVKEKILRCTNKAELSQTYRELTESVLRELDTAGNHVREELMSFLEGPGKSALHHTLQWKEEIVQKFNAKLEKAKDDCIEGIKGLYQKQKFEFKQALPKIVEENDISRIEHIIGQTRMKHGHNPDIAHLVDETWKKLKKEKESIQESQNNLTEKRVTADVEKILIDQCKAEKHLLDRARHPNKSLREWSLKKISVNDEFIKKRTSLRCTDDQELRDRVENSLEELKDFLQNEIDSICTNENPYSKTQVERIILGGKFLIDKQRTNITREFWVELYLSVAGDIVQELPLKQQLERKKSQHDSLERQKQYMKPLLGSLLEPGRRKSFIASGITTMVIEEVLKKIMTDLPKRPQCLSGYYSLSKLYLIKRLLRESIAQPKDKDYKAFQKYMSDPKSAIEYMLERSLTTDKLFGEAMQTFKKTVNDFLMNFKARAAKTDLTLAAHLTASLSAIGISISKESENIIKAFKGDTVVVIEEVSKSIERYSSMEAEREVKSKIFTKSDTIKQTCVKELIKSRFGCCEKCPFCNEVCMYEVSDHAGPHETTMHRPVACSGAFFESSKVGSLDSCPNWIASDAKMEIRGKMVPFRSYKDVFPNWKIHANASMKVSYVWKWFFYYHRSMLPRSSNINVPTSWKVITENKVLSYLRTDTYSVHCTDV